jgi:hypothetical protein
MESFYGSAQPKMWSVDIEMTVASSQDDRMKKTLAPMPRKIAFARALHHWVPPPVRTTTRYSGFEKQMARSRIVFPKEIVHERICSREGTRP